MEPVRWLTDEEQRAWRRLAAVVLRLPATLERQLQRDAGMTHVEYRVLALLSEEPDGQLPLRRLAAQANASLSRLSHVVTRLEERSWVVRQPDPTDGRTTLAVLTEQGREVLVAAAPGHVAAVRSVVFEPLSERDVADLERIAGRIAARLDEPPATNNR
ncbi:MAG: MarR family transcriptional regulator [Nitriliruptoraceae bacterium]